MSAASPPHAAKEPASSASHKQPSKQGNAAPSLPSSSPAPDLNEADLAACEKVLKRLQEDQGMYEHKRLRGVRASLFSLLDRAQATFHGGTTPAKQRNRKAHRQALRYRRRELDKALLSRTAMRGQRLQRLQDLAASSEFKDALRFMVPDGPVLDTPPALRPLALPPPPPPPSLPPPATGANIPRLRRAISEVESGDEDEGDGDGAELALVATMHTHTDVAQRERSAAAVKDAASAVIGVLHTPRPCYICKGTFTVVHAHYDQLCPACATLNYTKRLQTADLRGRVAIVTGGRIKIGFYTALKLLRAGAHVVITTRFPQNGVQRFQTEPDFEDWKGRLEIYGLDMRDLAAVEGFGAWFASQHSALDILINNAAQTLRRPPAYYRHLIADELRDAPSAAQIVNAVRPKLLEGTASSLAALPPPLMSQLPLLLQDTRDDDAALFPPSALDTQGQQIDLRKTNSWMLPLDQVSSIEAAECMAINTLAPFILCGRLKPLMEQSSFPDRYIVNVSSMEGRFSRRKNANHPHTNMAKAALNMMTRTSAAQYAMSGIYMNAVDTGWVNDQRPAHLAHDAMQRDGFQAPLDEVDGAARILDPVFVGVRDKAFVYGAFLKDYAPTTW